MRWLMACAAGCSLVEQRPDSNDVVMVIVAARDLYPGMRIAEDDLFAVQIPPAYLPAGVYLSPEYVVGRISTRRTLANEFVRADSLYDPADPVGPSGMVPPGHRLLDLPARDLGAASPRDLVDAWWEPDGAVACTAARDLSIVALDTQGSAPRVSVAAPAEWAAELTVAARHPSFRLVLHREASARAGRPCAQ